MAEFYPYRLNLETDADGGFVVTSPDVPELVTQGDTKNAAIEAAHDAMLTAFAGYKHQLRAFPVPEHAPDKDCIVIALPKQVQAEILLFNTSIEEAA